MPWGMCITVASQVHPFLSASTVASTICMGGIPYGQWWLSLVRSVCPLSHLCVTGEGECPSPLSQCGSHGQWVPTSCGPCWGLDCLHKSRTPRPLVAPSTSPWSPMGYPCSQAGSCFLIQKECQFCWGCVQTSGRVSQRVSTSRPEGYQVFVRELCKMKDAAYCW
jgi:hypothetical protein